MRPSIRDAFFHVTNEVLADQSQHGRVSYGQYFENRRNLTLILYFFDVKSKNEHTCVISRASSSASDNSIHVVRDCARANGDWRVRSWRSSSKYPNFGYLFVRTKVTYHGCSKSTSFQTRYLFIRSFTTALKEYLKELISKEIITSE